MISMMVETFAHGASAVAQEVEAGTTTNREHLVAADCSKGITEGRSLRTAVQSGDLRRHDRVDGNRRPRR